MNVSGRPDSRIPAVTSSFCGFGSLGLVEARESRRLEQVALLEDRQRPSEPPGMLRQPAEPEANRATDRSGADSFDVARGLRGRGDPSFRERVHEHAHQERCPARCSEAGFDEDRIRNPGETRLHELGDRCFRQRRQADHISGGVRRHARKQLGIGARLARAGCQDERNVKLFDPREQKGQVTKRGGVYPVCVVYDDTERACGGQVRAQPVEAVEDCERGIDTRRVRAVPRGCARKPKNGCRHAGSVLEQIGALELRCLGQRRLEKLTHYSEGEIALQLGPAGRQHAHPAVCRRPTRRGEQGRLTNPGLPFDDHESPTTGASFGQGRFDPRQFLGSFKERCGGLAPLICLEHTIDARKLGALATVRWRTREFPARRW